MQELCPSILRMSVTIFFVIFILNMNSECYQIHLQIAMNVRHILSIILGANIYNDNP